jgi:hypothetical protein
MVAISLVSFLTLFYRQRVVGMSFWLPMAATSGGCAFLGLLLMPESRRRLRSDFSSSLGLKTGLGLLSAGVLYGVFLAGNLIARRLWPDAGGHIDRVYTVAGGTDPRIILLWIALVIGPAEEILWRGVIQDSTGRSLGRWTGLAVSALLYALAHATSGNPMLVLAAGVCGLFWGLCYLWKQSIVLNVVSHVAWDLAVFLWIPFATGPGS